MPLIRRRRPLLRAAAVGGGAYAMGKHRARREEQEAQGGYEQQPAYAPQPQYAPQPAPAAPPPSGGGMSEDVVERLRQLGELHEQGVLTDEEFSREKSKLLA